MANQRKDHPAPHPPAHGQLSEPAHGQAEKAETEATPPARVKSTPPPAPRASNAGAVARAPAPATPQVAQAAPSPDDERVEYRPNRKVHLTAAGPVSLGNWVGRVGNKFVRVYRGAQAKDIPEAVIAAMAETGIEIGIITYQELGLRQPPATTLLR